MDPTNYNLLDDLYTLERRLAACSSGVANHKAFSLHSPLLSVFVGAGAHKAMRNVADAYQRCWGQAAKSLPMMFEADYSGRAAETAIARMSEQHDLFAQGSQYTDVYIAYYCDLTDDNFDELFEKIKDQPTIHSMFSLRQIVFAFVRIFEGSQLYRQRFNGLYAWAGTIGASVVCMTDIMGGRHLGAQEYDEGYRICADVLLLANSDSSSTASARSNVASTLFGGPMSNASLFGISYCSLGKDNRSIALVALKELIAGYERYDSAKALGSRGSSSKILGKLGFENKTALLLSKCRELINQAIVLDLNTYYALPYTDEVMRLDTSFQQKKGLFSRSSRPSHDELLELARDAADSLGRDAKSGLWSLFYQRYFDEPLYKYLIQHEEALIQSFKQLILTHISYKEIGLLEEELFSDRAANTDTILGGLSLEAEMNAEAADDMATYLDQIARLDLLHATLPQVEQLVMQAVREVSGESGGFEKLLSKCKGQVESLYSSDPLIEQSYGSEIRDVIEKHQHDLFDPLQLCVDAESFSRQINEVFDVLIACAPNDLFSKTFKDDIAFKLAPGVSVDDIVHEFYSRPLDMTASYVPVGGNYQGGLPDYSLDAPWDDKLERLKLFRIENPDSISWK